MNLEKYNLLKKKCERLKSEADQAEGARNQLLQKLGDEYDCKSIKQAEKLLKKLESEKEEAETNYSEEMEIFEEKWGTVLGVD